MVYSDVKFNAESNYAVSFCIGDIISEISRLKDKGKCRIFVGHYQAANGLNVILTAKQMLFLDSALNFT